MAKTSNLHKAIKAKNDEYWTQLHDIEKEMKYNKHHFKDQVVFCNCDDPEYSNFWKYFELNFTHLGLKKLIATHYEEAKPSYKLEITRNGNEKTSDIVKTPLKQNGDFRSPECIEILKEATIVVTNPPFSLFREYISQLIENEKPFIILGNINAITYKEIFPFLKDNKVWLGYNTTRHFLRPDGVLFETARTYWYTNLNIPKTHENIILYKTYNEKDYPKYDNYNAINVDKTKDIPVDYDGYMGVPITFMDKYNPEQFEILGLSQKVGMGLESTKDYKDYRETRQDGTQTGSSGKKTNGNPVLKGKPKKGNYFINENGDIVHSLYARILIKNKTIYKKKGELNGR